MTEFICLDIETTGLDVSQDSIIEFAAARFNENKILEEYQTFIHYPGPIPAIVEHLTGINQQMLEDAPRLDEIKQKILDFCGDLPIMGHNINFDLSFLHTNDVPVPGFQIDTLPLSQTFVESPSYSLETLCRRFNEGHQPTHRALDDVLANIELFQTFLKKIKELTPEQTYLWQKILSKTQTPYAESFLKLIPNKTQKPEFNPIPEKQLTIELQTPTVEQGEGNILNKIKDHDQNSLFVLSEQTLKQDLPGTRLPNYLSLISNNYFQDYVEKQPEFNSDEMHFLLKVATKITEKNPLYKTDLKLFRKDYDYLNSILLEKYIIPESKQPYLVDHYTFFKLFKEKELPSFEQIHFEKHPFLEEIFVRSQQNDLTLTLAENGQSKTELTFAFANLGKFANTLSIEQSHYRKDIILSALDLTSQEFLDFLHALETHSENPHLAKHASDLRSGVSKYLVWLRTNPNGNPSISFILKNIHLELEDLLNHTLSDKVFIYHSSQEENPFYLNLNETLPEPNSEGHMEQISETLYQKFKDIKKQGVIISTSKAQITELHKDLAKKFDKLGISLLSQYVSGSKGKILDNILNNEGPHILLCTHHFLIRNHPELDNLDLAAMTKIPMSLPHHPYYDWLKKETDNDFMKLTIPYTSGILYQVCQSINGQNELINSLEMLDKRLFTTHWGQKIVELLPKNVIVE